MNVVKFQQTKVNERLATGMLYTPSQIEAGECEGLSQQDWQHLYQSLRWTLDFIAKPHPNMGRPGSVCPFVKPSIQQGLLYFALCQLQSRPISVDEITERMHAYHRQFLALPSPSAELGKLKCLVVVLPAIPDDIAESLMEPLHKSLKTEFLKEDVMLGQFYATCKVPATTNPDFYPLQSPLPLFVFRTFIESDWRFLEGHLDWESTYLEKFSQAKQAPGTGQSLEYTR